MTDRQEKQYPVTVEVNGERRTASIEARKLLVHLLRDDFGLTGTHVGCDTSQCGACTIDIDGQAVKSCTVLAVMADGSSITTIEGLAPGGADSRESLADLQRVIQISPGWSDEYQHRFCIRNHFMGASRPGGLLVFGDPEEMTLSRFAFRLCERFTYEYNFFDSTTTWKSWLLATASMMLLWFVIGMRIRGRLSLWRRRPPESALPQ